MRAFEYESLPSRVVFGRGAVVKLPELAAELGMRRPLIVATGSQARTAEQIRGSFDEAVVFAGAAMHTPVEVTEQAMRALEQGGADGLIAVGGGSAIGLSKALALRTDLPQIVLPTTYAGSEMTPILGQTEAGRKTTQRSARVLPEAVVYDVDLTLSLPPLASVTSGFNAMAHAVEALYGQNANLLLIAAAEECVRVMAAALPRIVLDPSDLQARAEAQEAGWLGGWCLGRGGSALHHKLCHILGGAFDLPHAETHTILLPHVLAYNLKASPDAGERLREALDTDDPASVLFDLAQSLGAPSGLKQIGMPRDGIDRVVEEAMAWHGYNPRPLEAKALRLMLLHAWRGSRPR